jgi:hypothetical protein
MGSNIEEPTVQYRRWRQAPGVPMPPPPEEPRFSRFTIIVLSIFGVVIVGALVVGGIALYQMSNPSLVTPTATVRIERAFAVSGKPTVILDGAAGDVTVRSGPAGRVAVVAVRTANGASESAAYQALSHVGVRMAQRRNAITIEVLISGGLLQAVRADLQITVPHNTILNLTSNIGKMTVSGVSGAFQLHANVGDITLNGVTLAPGSTLATQTGTITLTGAFGGLGVYTIETVNGNVVLNLAPGSSFHVHARTTTGTITSGFTTIPPSTGVGADVSGTIGDAPDALVEIQVSTGDIALNRQ